MPDSLGGGLSTAVLLFVAVAAAVTDLRQRRIPNSITITGTLLGLLLAALGGGAAFLQALGGAGIGLAIGMVCFALGILGGGDAKLLMAFGALMGMARLPGALLVSGALGGVVALVFAIRKGVIVPALLGTGRILVRMVGFGRGQPAPVSVSKAVGEVPYGLAISAGSVFWWFFGGAL
ncbi:MAG TPA: A24 family peptidase [Gemmatimonadales bacterium]